jgi:hypothetical protein
LETLFTRSLKITVDLIYLIFDDNFSVNGGSNFFLEKQNFLTKVILLLKHDTQ